MGGFGKGKGMGGFGMGGGGGGWGDDSWGWGGKGGGWGGGMGMGWGMPAPLPAAKGKKKGGSRNRTGNPTHVFVGGVKANPTEEEVRAVFSVFGAISEVKMMAHEDGKLKGFLFVCYENEDSAVECVKNAAGITLSGDAVDVKSADGGKDTKPGDWTCPMCYNLVFSFRDTCNGCGYYGGYFGVGGKGGKSGGNSGPKPGDWTCPGCDNNVFARKDKCGKCGAAKPEGASSPY
eukprot:TRINITY_DN22415_c0_g1_i2.p1 TRINITY_DN22415_c0_g1~~TRINITY_DN22415_c0_g1_i2.p1  ORF type:complete len:233 (+),score=76.36 TRINITY_DN22415_c0_g1_i2:73-771(+)